MPPKGKPGSKGKGAICLSTGNKKATGSKTGNKTGNKNESRFRVRQECPKQEDMLPPKQVKDKYMITLADHSLFEAARDKKVVDQDDPAFKLNKQVMYGQWWPTGQIVLPTQEHFPFEKDDSSTLKATKDMGLIRPVSKSGLHALEMAFDEHGGLYDAGHPVTHTCITSNVDVACVYTIQLNLLS
jgi:hypothetical protein